MVMSQYMAWPTADGAWHIGTGLTLPPDASLGDLNNLLMLRHIDRAQIGFHRLNDEARFNEQFATSNKSGPALTLDTSADPITPAIRLDRVAQAGCIPTVDSVTYLRARLIETAQSVEQMYERIAATMDMLAERGGMHAERRRGLAEQARIFAEVEASHIAALKSALDREIDLQGPVD